jgi:hypothetical protein
MKQLLEEVFARELERLNEKSLQGPLSLDDLKALSLLTQSLKSYTEPAKAPDNPLKDLTTEQLLQLLEKPQEEATPNVRKRKAKGGDKAKPRT